MPVGTVLATDGVVFPKAAGNDIGCGMALATLDVTRDEFTSCLPALRPMLRHAFFEGGRSVPMSAEGREAILRDGVAGLGASLGLGGLLDDMTQDEVAAHAAASATAALPTRNTWSFDGFIRGSGGVSRDAQIGSLSGGNHFLEIGYVTERLDGAAMHALGLARDRLTVLAHNGSVGFGTSVGTHWQRVAEDGLHGTRRPAHGFLPLSLDDGQPGHDYLNAMGLAANFAAANRVVLLRMAASCIGAALGRAVRLAPLLDSPHNLVWAGENGRALHRKGAAPAEQDRLIVVPGSSGTPTLLFTGLGLAGTHASAPHGAGRAVRRGQARDEGPRDGEVLPPLDPAGLRPGIAKIVSDALAQEAPRQYKPIEAIGATVTEAGMGRPLGVLRPLLTVKRS